MFEKVVSFCPLYNAQTSHAYFASAPACTCTNVAHSSIHMLDHTDYAAEALKWLLTDAVLLANFIDLYS